MPDITTLLSYFLTSLYNGTYTFGSGLSTQGVRLVEQVAPAPVANQANIFALDVAGVTKLMVQGPTGPAVKVATGGALYWENTNLPNAADTNYVGTTLYTLPAGTMVSNGDELLIEWVIAFSSAVSSKTYQINIGHSAFGVGGFTGGQLVLSAATAAASASIVCTVVLRRLSATTGSWVGMARWVNATTVQGTNYATGNIAWANALAIQAGAKDGTGNAAAVTLNEFRVTYRPAP